MNVAPHPLDDALRLTPVGDPSDGCTQGRTSAAYANMVGPYGGCTAATMLQAVLQHPDRIGEPLALTVNFAGPVRDGAFEVAARPVRTNRSTQHWSVELRQGDEVATTATAVLAVRRETWAATDVEPPDVAPAPAVPPVPDIVPLAWVANYEMRFVRGGFDELSGSGEHPDSTTCLWVRDRPARPLDFVGLTALCDVFFPRVFLRRHRMTNAGTVSMTVHFHADAAELAAKGDRPVLAVASAQRYGGGYFDQSAQLWGDDRVLLATSHQVVYFKG